MKPLAKAVGRRGDEDRLDVLERDLRRALLKLEAVNGEASEDDQQIGVARFLIEQTLETLATLRGPR